jgi:hypothetical protein
MAFLPSVATSVLPPPVLYSSNNRAFFRMVGMDTDHWASAQLKFDEPIESVHFANDDRDLLITLEQPIYTATGPYRHRRKTTIVFDYEHLFEQPTAPPTPTRWRSLTR